MTIRVLTVSLLAGLLAGLVVAALQHVTTTPLILKAETYEAALDGARWRLAALDGEARLLLAHTVGAELAEWKPQDGLQRTALTSLVTVATAIGFAALLLGGLLAADQTIDERNGLSWGICGFLAFGLLPAAGLAPELPGAAAADLAQRQIWWLSTAGASAIGLYLILARHVPWLRLAGLVLLLAPHLVGAPHPAVPESKVPAEIAAQFAALSLVVQAALWVATGYAVGLLWPRMARGSGQ